ncbi:MAG: SDR family oxidoreductase [Acidobacteria bacterium]|nr:SDR family oxidoreductase [Acidobacteriota bacterium]
MQLLAGKVAIVTGAGRGIGRAVAQLLSAHGAKVVVNDLDPDPVSETATAIHAAGGECVVATGSVTDPAFPDHLVQTALSGFGSIDILVNNAGYTWDGVIHKMSDAQFDAMLDVHLKAPFRIIRAASEYLRGEAKKALDAGERPPCRKIINVSSTSGVAGNAGQINYAAGKMGVVGMTKTVAKEWGRFNICCNAVAYGFIDTRLTQAKEIGETTAGGVALGIPESVRENQLHHIPLGRAGTPEDAAGPVLFLASPLSDYVTGAVVLVTGGMVM